MHDADLPAGDADDPAVATGGTLPPLGTLELDELEESEVHAPRRAATTHLRVRDALLGLSGIAAALGLWALVSHYSWIDNESLPPPGPVGRRIVDLLREPDFRTQVLDTLQTWFVGMVLGAAVAIPLGIVIGWFRGLHRPAEALVHSLRSVPATALIPLAILLFGLGIKMKVSLVLFAVFWPILLNAIYGVRSVDATSMMVGRSLRWSRVKILWRIVLPSAAPPIASGLRVASGVALVVTFSAELLGASTGIGTEIVAYQQVPAPDYVYAGIVLVGVIGTVLYGLMVTLERRSIPWSQASRRAGR